MLQTIMAAKRASTLTGNPQKWMKANDLVEFLIEEAQHHIINDECSKNSDQALTASTRKGGKGKSKAWKADDKTKKDGERKTCSNCKRIGHKSEDCYGKGGGKEGQALWQKKKTLKKDTAVVAVADTDKDEMFVFTCTSDFANIAKALQNSKEKWDHVLTAG